MKCYEDRNRECELGCRDVCVRLRTVPRCPHGRHPGECGQCLAGTSLFVNTLKFAKGFIADRRPGVYRVRLNDECEIVEMTNITDDGK